MPDIKLGTGKVQTSEKPSEPPILWDRVENTPPREHDADRARHAEPDDQQRSETKGADKPCDTTQAPPLRDEYDLSLVEEERELRRHTRRR